MSSYQARPTKGWQAHTVSSPLPRPSSTVAGKSMFFTGAFHISVTLSLTIVKQLKLTICMCVVRNAFGLGQPTVKVNAMFSF